MTPVHQTIRDADTGNCFTASLASILDLPIDAVPNFAADHGDDWEAAAKAWLASRSLAFVTLGFAAYETFAATHFDNAGRYCVLSGPSTYPGRGHAVVGRVTPDGSIALAHDPCPGGQGLPKGHRWVRFVVPVVPEPKTFENLSAAEFADLSAEDFGRL